MIFNLPFSLTIKVTKFTLVSCDKEVRNTTTRISMVICVYTSKKG